MRKIAILVMAGFLLLGFGCAKQAVKEQPQPDREGINKKSNSKAIELDREIGTINK